MYIGQLPAGLIDPPLDLAEVARRLADVVLEPE
jgi:hypothetical protein